MIFIFLALGGIVTFISVTQRQTAPSPTMTPSMEPTCASTNTPTMLPSEGARRLYDDDVGEIKRRLRGSVDRNYDIETL